MTDIFLPYEFGKIFTNQHIVMIGDSQMRGIYKDFVWFLNHDSIIPEELVKSKLEPRFPDLENTTFTEELCDEVIKIFDEENRDYLLDSRGLTSGRTFIEPRRYYNREHNITIYYKFITKAYSEDVKDFLLTYEETYGKPIDTIIMNSCLWDVNRNGPFAYFEYKKCVEKLLELVPKIIHKGNGSFFWLTNPSVAKQTQSRGMYVPGLEFQCVSARFDVVEANYVAATEVLKAGYGVIDLQYLLQFQQFRRRRDGIHWNAKANRLITNLIITHVQLWMRDEEEENGLTGRVGCQQKGDETDKVWESHNFAIELVKIKAKKVKEGLKSEVEVRKALQKLEDCIEPIIEKEKILQLTNRVKEEKMREALLLRKSEYQRNIGYNTSNRFHPYAQPPPIRHEDLTRRQWMNFNQDVYSSHPNQVQSFYQYQPQPANQWNYEQGRGAFQPHPPNQWNNNQGAFFQPNQYQHQQWNFGQMSNYQGNGWYSGRW